MLHLVHDLGDLLLLLLPFFLELKKLFLARLIERAQILHFYVFRAPFGLSCLRGGCFLVVKRTAKSISIFNLTEDGRV